MTIKNKDMVNVAATQKQIKTCLQTKIRKAKTEDASKLAKLWHEMALLHAKQGNYWQIKRGCAKGYQEHITEMIADNVNGIFVAEVEETIVGFIVAQVANRAKIFIHMKHGMIVDLAVTQKYRRKGIGEKLCRRALRGISNQGLCTAEIRFSVDNPLSNGFWTKMGFNPYMSMMKMEL